jgi:hypothetical protein
MTGIQLPTSPPDPTERPNEPTIAVDRDAPQAPSAGGRSPLVTLTMITLGAAVLLLGVLLAVIASDRGDLAADNDRLAADNDRLAADNEQLADELRAWEQDLGWEEPFLDEATTVFTTGPVEQLLIDGAGRYAFEAEAGQLLELTAPDDGGFLSIELSDDAGRYLGWAELGSFPEAGYWGGPSDHAWFVFDRDGSYELTAYAEDPYGPSGSVSSVTAELHTLAGGLDRIVDVAAPYPTDGQVPVHAFDGRAGQLAIVTMTSERPEALDPFIWLYGPDGTLIGQDDDGGGTLDARLIVRLPQDGRYEVEADVLDGGLPLRSNREAPYTLTVELADTT